MKAGELKVQFIETSAKVGINIKPLFKDLAATLPGVGSETTKPSREEADSNTQGFKLGEGGNKGPQES